MRKAYALLALGFMLCSQPLSAQPRLQSLQDRTNRVAVHVPDTWQEANLGSPDATLQLTDETGDVAFIVIVEDKGDLYGWNLDRLHYITLGNMMVMTDLPEVSDPEHVLIDEAPAIKITVRGSANGVQLVYMRAVVDTPESYVQLIGWTSRSKWEASRDVLESILASVEFLPVSSGPR